MTLRLVTASEDAPPTAAEDPLARMRDAIAAKGRELAEAEAKHAGLVAEDAKLVAIINENRRVAAMPEPQAADFGNLDEWHAALRKLRTDRAARDEALPPIERDRNRLANQEIPAARSRIGSLRIDIAQLEFDLALAEHRAAVERANELHGRVQRLRGVMLSVRAQEV